MYAHTSDLSDGFFVDLVAMCGRLGCKPIDMLGCWMSESGVSPKAHNPGGNASGLFQAMPATLSGLGYPGHWDDYIQLSAEAQLTWAERYYGPHKGYLVSAAACYLITFLPALAVHADESSFVLCAQNGPFAYAYAGNFGAFDPEKKGYITVQDLSDRIARVTHGSRWQELLSRLQSSESGSAASEKNGASLDLTCVEGQQCALSQLGYECEVDGVWGEQSSEACRSFQADNPPLEQDGICGVFTQAALADKLRG